MFPLALRRSRFNDYAALMRLDRPIGALLLMWPTLWALWMAADGVPDLHNLLVFTLGVMVMRAAGCVINDFADRHVDGHVQRTRNRPLATGRVTPREAITLFLLLGLLALALVSTTNLLTIALAVPGLALAISYPFMKRVTHLPQLVLGLAFSWGIPMAYAAQANAISPIAWLLLLANFVWTIAYDTMYAMVDRNDDRRVGIKSLAVLLGDADRVVTAMLQLLFVAIMLWVGAMQSLGTSYYLGLAGGCALMVYQQYLIRDREREACFRAFLNNNWVGAMIFAGLIVAY
ncbi:MAG: 4-hydroxybenzoate octaprenyltransferase [Gammaproteobacteria bacterium]|nr:4-hydroxybenzoate octaprenyltransferase [Gammaproteobacteria bacterium]